MNQATQSPDESSSLAKRISTTVLAARVESTIDRLEAAYLMFERYFSPVNNGHAASPEVEGEHDS